MLMFLMRAHMPTRYRYAHASARHPGEPDIPAVPHLPGAGGARPATCRSRRLLGQAERDGLLEQAAELADINGYRDPDAPYHRFDPRSVGEGDCGYSEPLRPDPGNRFQERGRVKPAQNPLDDYQYWLDSQKEQEPGDEDD